ncbi:hypothetical protein GRX01_15240 [Halobaculum sp. WSA2]|uniref:Uncharacterized protein n=1 Tax=Halobaculum saliterrae TaxID=2073113 RepID=A0A6B0SVN2_9EURY|nr:hypothetical protein [Halobaculum saliterrae]MXR42687.1 hypothetical protein [Halobaculum saliterrae]
MTDEDGAANADDDPDALREDEPDWQLAPDSEEEFAADAETRELLRAVAEDVRGDSGESKQLSAILYRVSDLYDPDEDTSPEEIYLNVRRIMQIKERGGLKRE